MVVDLADTAPPLYGLVNNAGVIHRSGIAQTSDEDWRRVMAVNLDGACYGMREVGPRLVANGGGAIVNVSSIGGLIGYPSWVDRIEFPGPNSPAAVFDKPRSAHLHAPYGAEG